LAAERRNLTNVGMEVVPVSVTRWPVVVAVATAVALAVGLALPLMLRP
jgi:hypothetical protein